MVLTTYSYVTIIGIMFKWKPHSPYGWYNFMENNILQLLMLRSNDIHSHILS